MDQVTLYSNDVKGILEYLGEAGLHITSKSLANASKIFRCRVTHAYYLPAGEYIKNSRYFSKTLNFYNLSVKHDVICLVKLDFPIISSQIYSCVIKQHMV